LPYDALVLATGSVPRRLPASIGGEPRRRTCRAHAQGRRRHGARDRPRSPCLIVGGGYIGLEAAAVCRKKGLDVTLIEMADRILARVACPETSPGSARCMRVMASRFLRGCRPDLPQRGDGQVVGAILSDMSEHPYDIVIAGIGITPATALAEAAGLEIDNGIKVDAQGRTSDPAIWAAGDCASFPYRGGRIRLESVQNAIDQAEAVAKNMLGAGEDYVPHPWFWSDQYDVKLQIAGLNTGYDRRGRARQRRCAVALVLRGRHAAVGRRDERPARLHGRQAPDRGRASRRSGRLSPTPMTDLKALLRA
jgi:3-phenylpropionate/trans-cinnamate dioxygenase ferredoxin reductase subunit